MLKASDRLFIFPLTTRKGSLLTAPLALVWVAEDLCIDGWGPVTSFTQLLEDGRVQELKHEVTRGAQRS